MSKVDRRRGAKRAANRRRRRKTLLYWRVAVGAAIALIAALALTVCLLGVALGPTTLTWVVAGVMVTALAIVVGKAVPLPKWVRWGGVALGVALIAFGCLHQSYALSGGRIVPRYSLLTELKVTDRYPAHFTGMKSLRTLDMRGSTVTDFEPIQALTALERVDLRDNRAFDRGAHDALAQALPGCEIRWSVPVGGEYYDSAADTVNASALPLTAQELRLLIADYPDGRAVYSVPLLGDSYPGDTVNLDLQGKSADVAAIEEALDLFPKLESVDLRGVKTPVETVAALCGAHPDIRFVFTCDVAGDPMTTDDAEVKVTGGYGDLLARMAYADYMPNLTLMDASDVDLTDAQLDLVQSNTLGGRLRYCVDVFGHRVSNQAAELNLDNTPVPSVEAMEERIARLPQLKCVSMCNTGLSEKEMGRLFDAHPEIKFIWWIEFGQYRLRTDATAFTTNLYSNNDLGYTHKTFAALRYCTDLMMLDLGHNRVKDLEFIRGLKKLRVLILADNKLKDISVLADLPDLEYVELFMNKISDVTPLTGLTKLVDLNLYYNPLYENYKPLADMTWLERLWIGGCHLSRKDLASLESALPNTRINVSGDDSTGKGWRKHPHYDTLKRMYDEGRYIPFD